MSVSNHNSPNPWAPNDSYKDCSQGICSIYCPQWCYIIFPPPPPPPLQDDSGTDFSPVIIALIGILASAFILLSYYAIISKFFRRRRHGGNATALNDHMINNETSHQAANIGLDEGFIKSITVCKYKRGEGLVEGTDCSVCLSEFQEDENLRLLPKCNHAFHLPCIDTWLKSHSSCPLCRANITASTNILPTQETSPRVNDGDINVSANQLQYQQRDEAVLVIHDPEEAVISRENVIEDGIQPIRRSVSMNSCVSRGPILVADILRSTEDDDEFQMERSIEKNSTTVVRSHVSLKRCVSTGRFVFTRYAKTGNYIIPN
ncbi:hypothetical protein Pint_20846 [Pistacia integerrima]|uniref:Uncharacterized protein n=1 Tax=Pistacia integerrima TaxID=434235 RepID=A0ACC0XCY8_9ROSI|nr:hypothetical protein Pint_20846 [Pistacia integerrima]